MSRAETVLEFIWKYRLWAFGISIVGLIIAVPQLINTWDVLCHRFGDSSVFEVLDRKVPGDTGYGGKVYYPLSSKEVADKLGRSEGSVLRSLRRLEKGKMGDRVIQADNGWYSERNARKN